MNLKTFVGIAALITLHNALRAIGQVATAQVTIDYSAKQQAEAWGAFFGDPDEDTTDDFDQAVKLANSN